MNRAVDLAQGYAYVVSDIHGEWEPYARYRDHFFSLYHEGRADHLIFLGDMIHGYGLPEEDYSVEILLDLMELQREYGPETVIMLLGNHELAHVYSVPISKGEVQFVPRFEHMLGERRDDVLTFLRSLPFLVRTAAGVMMTHAGASTRTATPDAAEWLLTLSHEALYQEVDRLLNRSDVRDLLQAFGQLSDEDYAELAYEQLAVEGPGDPRYYDLLRGFIVSNLDPEWDLLWEFFFTQAENRYQHTTYTNLVDQFLRAFSPPGMPQVVLVSGHLPVDGGYEIVTNNQLRIASWTHAHPKREAAYLIFDASQRIEAAVDLERDIYPMP